MKLFSFQINQAKTGIVPLNYRQSPQHLKYKNNLMETSLCQHLQKNCSVWSSTTLPWNHTLSNWLNLPLLLFKLKKKIHLISIWLEKYSLGVRPITQQKGFTTRSLQMCLSSSQIRSSSCSMPQSVEEIRSHHLYFEWLSLAFLEAIFKFNISCYTWENLHIWEKKTTSQCRKRK